MEKYEWIKEGSLVDFKSGYEWKIGKIRRVTEDLVEVISDEAGFAKKSVRFDGLAPFRKYSGLKALADFAVPVNLDKTRFVCQILNKRINELLEEDLKGHLPSFIYGFLKSEIFELLNFTKPIFDALFGILKLSAQLLHVYKESFENWENLDAKDKTLCETWPEILDLTEKILGKEEFFKNFYEICEYLPEGCEVGEIREGFNITQSALINFFCINGGVLGFSQLFELQKSRSNRPFALVLQIDLGFYRTVLPQSVASEFLLGICDFFIIEIQTIGENSVKPEDFYKIFKNLAAISEELPMEKKQNVEDFYLNIVFQAFFSNNLEKRFKSVSEICSFIENASRCMTDQELLTKIEEKSVLENILEGRVHHQILKKSNILLEFVAKHGKFSEKYLKMLNSIKDSPEKVTFECFSAILNTIFPYLSSAQQKYYKAPVSQPSLIFFTEDKVFDAELFRLTQKKNENFSKIQESLINISEIIINPSNISIQSTFIDYFPEGVQDIRHSFQYFAVLLNIFKQFSDTELSTTHKRLSLSNLIIKNLGQYMESLGQKVAKTSMVFNIPHFFQISIRFELLEYLQMHSAYKVSNKHSQTLLKLCFLSTTDETVQSIYTNSITKCHKFTSILTNPSQYLEFLNTDQFFSSLSSNSFRIFRHSFFLANQNVSLEISKGRFVCVLSKNIEGLQILFKLLYKAKSVELRSVKKLIRNILTCYSLMLTDSVCTIFSENLQLLWTLREENCDDNARYIGIVYDLVYGSNEKNDKMVELTLMVDQAQGKIEVSENCSVFCVRKCIVARTNYDLSETAFKFKEKVYTCKQNIKMLKFVKDDILVFVHQSEFLELGFNYFSPVLMEIQEIFWKYAVSDEKCRKMAFDITKCLKTPVEISKIIESLQITGEELDVNKLELAAQVLVGIFRMLENAEWLEKLKTHKVLLLVHRTIVEILKVNHIKSYISLICLKIVQYTISVPNSEPLIVSQIYVDIFFWLASNLNNCYLFDEAFYIITQLTDFLLTNHKNEFLEYFNSILVNSLQNLVQIFEKNNKDSVQLNKYVEYLKYFIITLGLLDAFIDICFSNLLESVMKSPLNGILLVLENFIGTLLNSNQEKAELLIVKLYRLTVKVYELPGEENQNLSYLFKMLRKAPQLIPDLDINLFLHEILFTLPQASNPTLPKCKSNESRKAALYLATDLSKIHRPYLIEIIGKVRSIIKSASWRTPQKKSWDISISSTKKPYKGLVGLKNPSCICYSNSLIQQLFHIESFQSLIIHLQPVKGILKVLQDLFTKLKHSYKSPISAKSIIRSLHQYSNYNEQMDADEYLAKLFEKILNDGSIEGETALNMHFTGTQFNEIISQDCEHRFLKEQNFFSFNVSISAGSLDKSLENFFSGEMLQYENAFYCEKCNKKVKALLKASFKTLPNYLVLSLRRFEYDLESNNRIKLNSKFVFREKLDLEKYLTDKIEGCFKYRLKGITLHVGNTDHGHYFSYIRTGEDLWIEFNDAKIEEISKEKLFKVAFGGTNDQNSPSAYILVYEKEIISFTEPQLSFKQRVFSLIPKENPKVIQKNESIKLQEIVFSDNFLDFIDGLIDIEEAHQLVSEFVLTTFIRMSLNTSYLFKMLKKFYESFKCETVIHIMLFICSELGCKEFLVYNLDKVSHRFLLLLVKKFISNFPEEVLKICFYSLVSVVNWIHRIKKDAPETILELIYLICSLIPDIISPRYALTNLFLRTYTRCYPEFPLQPTQIKKDILCAENYSNISADENMAPNNFSPLFRYLANSVYVTSEADINYIKSEHGWARIFHFKEDKSSSISLTHLYCSLYEFDIEGAAGYLNHLLELSMGGENSYLKLISLFINNYSKRIEILSNFIDFYINLIPVEIDHDAAYRIKYMVKFLRKVKMSEIINILPQELIVKMQILVDCFLEFKRNSYEAGKIKKIFEVFSQDLNEDINDSDDEIEETYLEVGKIVFFCDQNESKRMRIDDNLNGEILLLRDHENRTRVVDRTNFHKVLISYN